MKCPSCDQEMKTVVVEYTFSVESYVLHEESGQYQYHLNEDTEPDDDDYSLYCGECGKELEGLDLMEFQDLILL